MGCFADQQKIYIDQYATQSADQCLRITGLAYYID